MLVFFSGEAASSRTIPRHSSADLGSKREKKDKGISSDCVGFGGEIIIIIIIVIDIIIMEYKRRLNYLSSVSSV